MVRAQSQGEGTAADSFRLSHCFFAAGEAQGTQQEPLLAGVVAAVGEALLAWLTGVHFDRGHLPAKLPTPCTVLQANPKGLGKEALLAWLAAVAGQCQSRTAKGEGKHVIDQDVLSGVSDRLALGAMALCLSFCKPFLGGEDKFLDKLDPSFYVAQAHRWGSSSSGDRMRYCALAGLHSQMSAQRCDSLAKAAAWVGCDLVS